MHDVCLLLEGSYPFVSGGVSSWIHNIIRALPEIRFTAVCLVSRTDQTGAPKYDLPDNFEYTILPLFDELPLSERHGRLSQKNLQHLQSLHQDMPGDNFNLLPEIMRLFQQERPPLHDIVHGRGSWELVSDLYEKSGGDDSFLDYFWTFRFTHLPLFQVLKSPIPPAKVYHAISTGYAGFLGCLAQRSFARPLLLTEHGIYTRERKIEIAQASWIPQSETQTLHIRRNLSLFQQLWVKTFEVIGRMTYAHCDRILTLYSGNRDLQIREGADPNKIEIVPNGIKVEAFSGLKPVEYPAADQHSFTVGFVGRVVPIKDVKTFLRAIKVALHSISELKAVIMGPTDEDPIYYEECRALVRQLELEDVVSFTGKVNVLEHYGYLDVIVLTSISEAQPLVVMEGNCAGIPCVCSDVGACSELLEGRSRRDKELGPSGIVTPVAHPVATGQAIVRILTDFPLRRRMVWAGRNRIRAFYQEPQLNAKYRELYMEAMQKPDKGESSWQE